MSSWDALLFVHCHVKFGQNQVDVPRNILLWVFLLIWMPTPMKQRQTVLVWQCFYTAQSWLYTVPSMSYTAMSYTVRWHVNSRKSKIWLYIHLCSRGQLQVSVIGFIPLRKTGKCLATTVHEQCVVTEHVGWAERMRRMAGKMVGVMMMHKLSVHNRNKAAVIHHPEAQGLANWKRAPLQRRSRQIGAMTSEIEGPLQSGPRSLLRSVYCVVCLYV